MTHTSEIEIINIQRTHGHNVVIAGGSPYGYTRFENGYWVEVVGEDGKKTIAVEDSKDLEAAFQDWIL